jgi:hypothetical protein
MHARNLMWILPVASLIACVAETDGEQLASSPGYVIHGELPRGMSIEDVLAQIPAGRFGVIGDPSTGQVATIVPTSSNSPAVVSSHFLVTAPAACTDCPASCDITTRTVEIGLTQDSGPSDTPLIVQTHSSINFSAPTHTPSSWMSSVGSNVNISTVGTIGTCAQFSYYFDIVECGPEDDCVQNDSVFVSSTGNDANPGTVLEPKATIQAGIDFAAATSKTNVYVAQGVYEESITLSAGVSVLGGYSTDFSSSGLTSIVWGQTPQIATPGAVNCTEIAGLPPQSTRFDGFSVYGAAATAPSTASYAVYLRDCDDSVAVTNNQVFAGSGGIGAAGSSEGVHGSLGANGTAGMNAIDVFATYGVNVCGPGNESVGGGGGVTVFCGAARGGNGGSRTCPTFNGETDPPVPSEYGQTGWGSAGGPGGMAGRDVYQQIASCEGYQMYPGGSPDPVEGSDGYNGGPGAVGSAGVGCSSPSGTVAAGLWQGTVGGTGGAGTPGGGGGGGGSGAGAYVHASCYASYGGDNVGPTGGGGGSGGCAATGGAGGTSGGGSLGIFVTFSSLPTSAPELSGNSITGGTGGAGGAGRNGGSGGTGGSGAPGGSGSLAGPTFPSFDAGAGGHGGVGGHGGGGGGGCGGPSYGIYVFGHGALDLSAYANANAFVLGSGGAGGDGGGSLGNPGGTGANGVASTTNL